MVNNETNIQAGQRRKKICQDKLGIIALSLVSFLCITDQLSYIIVVTFAVMQYKNVYGPACLHFYGVDILEPCTQCDCQIHVHC
jgi:hypothetical protein